jgi:hypothetical protein
MGRIASLLVFSSLIFYCCNRKQYICPAYGTYFIHDDKELEKRFIPFNVDSLSDNSNNQAINNTSPDSTNYTVNQDNGSNNKYQPKVDVETKGIKKLQPNGLVVNSSSGKKKPRNNNDIEMITIMAKPVAQYSNIDSTNSKLPGGDGTTAPKDSL